MRLTKHPETVLHLLSRRTLLSRRHEVDKFFEIQHAATKLHREKVTERKKISVRMPAIEQREYARGKSNVRIASECDEDGFKLLDGNALAVLLESRVKPPHFIQIIGVPVYLHSTHVNRLSATHRNTYRGYSVDLVFLLGVECDVGGAVYGHCAG